MVFDRTSELINYFTEEDCDGLSDDLNSNYSNIVSSEEADDNHATRQK